MDGIGAGCPGGRYEGVAIQVTGAERRELVRGPHPPGVALIVRGEGDGSDAHGATRPGDPDDELAAVGDEQPADGADRRRVVGLFD
jgi:hypothetical protein